MYAYAKILASIRKKKGLTQQMLAEQMTALGVPTKAPAISAWEKENNQMNATQFLAMCEVLDIQDINLTFHVAEDSNPFARLTEEGKCKVYEYIDLLLCSGRYEKKPAQVLPFRRKLEQYDLATSAGPGEFLDSDSYELVEVGPEVPESATFGVRVNGDSMEPTIENHSVVWVHKQDSLMNGDIGVFYVDGQTYCKRFIQYASNAVKLLSDNPDYKPINITENSSFKIFGKVVAHTAPKQ